ncbi:MAG: protoporphyrinogen oxidase HemJ [Alphaproteobacteria bacterium]|nr:protoporphyrinogen oxidase HemJ [Alphaproteobacteria bacterium]
MYLWIKAFHLIAAISWMVGLLYLPRLYVYHAMVEPGSARAETFALMERRLLKAIMNPAMIVTFGLGLWMIHLNPGLIEQNWFLTKSGLVFLLAGVHGKLAKMRKGLESGEDIRSDRYYRVWNEVPTVFLIAIVILVIVQPF